MADLDPTILAWLRRSQEMSTLTNGHSVREHWKWWHERTPGRVDIVIHANVSWESKVDHEIDLGIGWIRPTLYEPVRAGPPFELPVMGHHDYGAGIPVEDVAESEPGRGLEVLGEAADKAAFITNCLSFLTGFAAWWRPARVMEVVHGNEAPAPGSAEKRFRKYFSLAPAEEMTSAVVDDEWVTRRLAPFIRVLWNLESAELRRVLLAAISWQAHANSTEGLGRYLHYFASVELVAHFLYGTLPNDVVGRVPQSEVQRKILELLLDVNSKNYMPTATKIADVLEVSARTKLKRIATLVDFDADVFFTRAQRDGKSLVDIRNDIAHGNIARDDRSYLEANREAIEKFRPATAEFVHRVAVALATGRIQIPAAPR